MKLIVQRIEALSYSFHLYTLYLDKHLRLLNAIRANTVYSK